MPGLVVPRARPARRLFREYDGDRKKKHTVQRGRKKPSEAMSTRRAAPHRPRRPRTDRMRDTYTEAHCIQRSPVCEMSGSWVDALLYSRARLSAREVDSVQPEFSRRGKPHNFIYPCILTLISGIRIRYNLAASVGHDRYILSSFSYTAFWICVPGTYPKWIRI